MLFSSDLCCKHDDATEQKDEIKYNKQLPQILSSIIQTHELKNVTFSKYSAAMEVAYEKTRPRQRYRHDLFTSAIKGRKG